MWEQTEVNNGGVIGLSRDLGGKLSKLTAIYMLFIQQLCDEISCFLKGVNFSKLDFEHVTFAGIVLILICTFRFLMTSVIDIMIVSSMQAKAKQNKN